MSISTSRSQRLTSAFLLDFSFFFGSAAGCCLGLLLVTMTRPWSSVAAGCCLLEAQPAMKNAAKRQATARAVRAGWGLACSAPRVKFSAGVNGTGRGSEHGTQEAPSPRANEFAHATLRFCARWKLIV